MGHESERKEPVKVYMMVDGEMVPVSTEAVSVEFTYHEGQPERKYVAAEMGAISFTVKIPKRMRCKSRKRFIKLLMASGIDRNTAQSGAGFIAWAKKRGAPVRCQVSYQSYYTDLVFFGAIRLA